MRSFISPEPQLRRAQRTPNHSFHVRHAPYEIQPFFIAPVLPGETMKNLSLQSRVLTKPLKSSLIGWWIEHYIYYVKHRDLADSSYLQALMLDDAATLASAAEYMSASSDLFTGWTANGTGYNFVKACLKAVILKDFRDEGEAWNAATIDSNPAAYVMQENWLNSAVLDTGMDAVDVTIPVDATPAPDVVYASEVARALQTWEKLRMQGALGNMTYQDYLRTFGLRVREERENVPELIRYLREWSYPSSHVLPSATVAGASDVTSACSWSIAERADKDRFFQEPGFVFGVTCCRPKIYLSTQKRPAVTLMDDLRSWLPAALLHDATASWKQITDSANDLIAGAGTGNWWVDIRDLLVYGDQFSNILISGASDMNGMALPTTALGHKHPVQASVDAMFVSGDATAGVWQDGIVRLNILGHIADTSPRGTVMGNVV